MVFILVILTVAVILTIELIRRNKKPAIDAVGAPALKLRPPTDSIERYFHPGHCWARVHHPELVYVGVDNFTQRLVGPLDTVELPREGMLVRQGQPFVTLHHGNKKITQVSPVSGIVGLVNQKLEAHPSLVNRSPYEKGWIARLIPTNLRTDVNNLLRGAIADRWQEAARMQLISWFTSTKSRYTPTESVPNLAAVLQDGGQLIDNISDLLTDDQWGRLVQEFYPCVYHQKHFISNL